MNKFLYIEYNSFYLLNESSVFNFIKNSIKLLIDNKKDLNIDYKKFSLINEETSTENYFSFIFDSNHNLEDGLVTKMFENVKFINYFPIIEINDNLYKRSLSYIFNIINSTKNLLIGPFSEYTEWIKFKKLCYKTKQKDQNYKSIEKESNKKSLLESFYLFIFIDKVDILESNIDFNWDFKENYDFDNVWKNNPLEITELLRKHQDSKFFVSFIFHRIYSELGIEKTIDFFKNLNYNTYEITDYLLYINYYKLNKDYVPIELIRSLN